MSAAPYLNDSNFVHSEAARTAGTDGEKWTKMARDFIFSDLGFCYS